MTPGRLKVWNEDAGEWQYTPGGSQPWDEHDISALEADWTGDGVGTWTFVDGVISQTNATADSGLQYNHALPSIEYVVEAEVRIPTGQDSGTTALAVIAAGCNDQIGNLATGSGLLVGEGAVIVADAAGDDSGFGVDTWVDGSMPGNVTDTGIAQGEWHTLRAVASGMRQVVYLDGAYVCSGETVSGGNDPDGNGPPLFPDLPGLGAVGLVDFSNVKVWTRPVPA